MLVCIFARQRNIELFWPIVGIAIAVFLGSGWNSVVRIPTEEMHGSLSMQWGYAFIPWRPVQISWTTNLNN
ncbi:MAG: hypothetical protein QGG54_18800 [Gammaproteobacteria bacterium]|nr:hypothetical protein [Gammaproteobacteria bacterium]MDP6537579.1 hypothetical protein [Gammaproteobacteria bacterium]MDP6733222.1 hypothetical protein [Gammaproteobacteria bacterium]